MKIGLVSTYTTETPPLSYGGEIFFWGLASEYSKAGHEVYLFAKGGSRCPQNGKLFYIQSTEKGRINYKREVDCEKKYHDLMMNMDVIHDCSLDHIAAERLRHLYGKKEIVNTINGHTYHMPRSPFNVVTGSKWWQEDAAKHGLSSVMIYWGIDTNFYCPGDKPREDYFLWLSRFHPSKGLDIVLDLAEFLGFPLKVAGSMQFSDHEEYGKKYLGRIKELPNVEYVPLPLDDWHHISKRKLYQNARAFLYPVEYQECFGMVVTEALACGCPVVTNFNGAMPEQVTDGVSGFLCKTKNDYVDAIQNKLPTYERNSSLHKGFDLRAGARQSAERFTWEKSAKAYLELFEQVRNGYSW